LAGAAFWTVARSRWVERSQITRHQPAGSTQTPKNQTELAREHSQQLAQWFARGLGAAFDSGSAVLLALMNLIMIPVVTFYLLRDWPMVMERVHALIPRRLAPTVLKLVQDADQMLSGFLRGQLSVMLALGIIYAIGLSLAGLETGVLIGLIAGLFSFVPYLGVIVGIGAASIAMYAQTGELLPLVWVLMVFGIGQVLESVFLQPYFVGDRMGLHPLAVIFAVLAGGQLFGFFGLLLALPVTAVLIVLLRHFWEQYQNSAFYADAYEEGSAMSGSERGQKAVTPERRD